MFANLRNKLTNGTRRYFIAAFAVVILVTAAIVLVPVLPIEYARTPDAVYTESAYVLPAAEPVRLRIPKVLIDAPFEAPLGVNEQQEIEVPEGYDSVGWYKYGPTPGERGPAIILGHVDSYDGPAVLFALGRLDVGDEILIDRADGSTATFVVTEMAREVQNNFPTEKVYGSINHAGLRIITCTGIFSHGSQRYSHNLIVYAALQDPQQ